MNRALSLYSEGRAQEALTLVKALLESQPTDVWALDIAGRCSLKVGQPAQAEGYWNQALHANPRNAQIHTNMGRLYRETARLVEAEAACRRAVEIEPGYGDAYRELAIALTGLQRFDEAEAAYRQALAIRHDDGMARNQLGLLLWHTGRLTDAEAVYRDALKYEPENAIIHYHLGRLLRDMRRLSDAETAYQRALTIKPDFAEACNDLALLLKEMRRFPEAEAAYGRTLEIQPDFAEACNDLGLLLHDRQRFAEAEAAYARALKIKPDFADAWNNLGLVWKETYRFYDAEVAFEHALSIKPDMAFVCYNLGNLLWSMKRFGHAERAYRRALVIDPSYRAAGTSLGLLLLYQGRMSEGWPLYEARHAEGGVPELPVSASSHVCSRWQGESLEGKSIVVLHEQGYGDLIQLVRYVACLKAVGARHVTLICPAPLRQLFESVEGADVVHDSVQAVPMPDHDFWIWMPSIPLHVGTTLDSIPATIPYLRAAPDRLHAWKSRLPTGRPRIGLVWKGSAANANNRNRSLSALEQLAPLWSVPDIDFVSLQKGDGEDEAMTPLRGQPLVHLGSDIKDFSDSAAVVAQLDLVIAVDTAIGHLAGALGTPCWILVPHIQFDWRWMAERTDSPWYPRTRLFRQISPDDWTATILEVADALHHFKRQWQLE